MPSFLEQVLGKRIVLSFLRARILDALKLSLLETAAAKIA